MIHICNWLLTRKCNLKCSYCSIVKDYYNKPSEYPNMKHYYRNEMSPEYVIECLKRLKKHNKNMFHIFYGGEPFLYKGLADVVNFCNKEEINYTIITNNSDEIQPLIKEFFNKVEYVTGLSSSVDPLVNTNEPDGDRYKKCVSGFNRLLEYRGKVKDLVAEMTVDNNNVDHMYDLVCMLNDNGINTDITFIDIQKNKYYDFSSVNDKNLLVQPTDKLKNQFDKIISEKLDVHMSEVLLPRIYDILPSDLDCGIEKNVHTITIDADGTTRLCLRIRGIKTPRLLLVNYISEEGKLNEFLKRNITSDKINYCKLCNHTCFIMSDIIESENNVQDLIHEDKRKF